MNYSFFLERVLTRLLGCHLMVIKPMRPRPTARLTLILITLMLPVKALEQKLFSLPLRFKACYIKGYNIETIEEYIETFSVTKTVQ